MPDPAEDLFSRLASFGTASIANAIDALRVRMANEGFADSRVSCRTPGLAPMVGQVVTLKTRSADISMKPAFYLDRPDWWELLPPGRGPRVLAIDDVDVHPGRGSVVGPLHACILQALGFVGVVTNGAIRGSQRFHQIGLHAFAGNLSPAHAYCHVVAVGGPVEIAGLRLNPGDIVHGDDDGLVLIPPDLAQEVLKTVPRFQERESSICQFCRSPQFTPEGLKRRTGADPSLR